jgi:hypothetical protein
VRRHAANKTKLSSGTVWFRRCKGLRLIARPRGNEDSINRSREGKTNFVVHVDLKMSCDIRSRQNSPKPSSPEDRGKS